MTQNKIMEVSFEYNLDSDTPEGIVNEMKSEIGLSESEID